VSRHLSRFRTAAIGAWRRVRPGAFAAVRRRADGAVALEIGGPSSVFRAWRPWPLYDRLARVDLANYAEQTLWDAAPQAVLPGGARLGRRFVAEASQLAGAADASYDLVLASHVLEHVANPLRALAEWARVLRLDGLLVLVLPHRDATFDHRRPVTSLAHLRDDEHRAIGEDDRTHEPEVLALHDLGRDPDAGDRKAFEARIRDNVRWRSLHHHVFDTEAALRLVDAAGFGITLLDTQRPHHICIVAAPGAAGGNGPWLAPDAAWRARSPFPSDRSRHAGAS
jgi:SAM-dependent methyltransferase